MMPVKEQ